MHLLKLFDMFDQTAPHTEKIMAKLQMKNDLKPWLWAQMSRS